MIVYLTLLFKLQDLIIVPLERVRKKWVCTNIMIDVEVYLHQISTLRKNKKDISKQI